MKKVYPILIAMVLAGGIAAQSVADAARQARANKRPSGSTIRYEGDATPRLAVAATDKRGKDKNAEQPADTTTSAAKAQEGQAAVAKSAEAKTADNKDEAKAKWVSKIEDVKKEIATIQRELDILQREQRLRAAAFYGDAGTRLRDQGKFAEESRKEQEDIDAKKQALADAQQKLADLQEQARKAGVPTT